MNKFRKPFDSRLTSRIVQRLSAMSREEFREVLHRAASDDAKKYIVDLPTITMKGIADEHR